MATKKRTVARRATQAKSKAISWMKAQNDLKTTGAFLVGVIMGRQVAVFLDKQTNKVSGIFGIDLKNKKIIADASVAALGLIGAQWATDKNIKTVAYGIASAGVINVVKDVTGKDLLAGIGDNFSLAGSPALGKAQISSEAVSRFLEEELDNDINGLIEDIDFEDIDDDEKEEPTQGVETIEAVVIDNDDDFAAGVDDDDDSFAAGVDDEEESFSGVEEESEFAY